MTDSIAIAAVSDASSASPFPHLIVPISSDWQTLGRGGGVETFVKLLSNEAAAGDLPVTVLCSGSNEGRNGSVVFRPVTDHVTKEFQFVRSLRRCVRRRTLRFPARSVVLAVEEHYAWAFRGSGIPVVLMSHGASPETLRMRHSSMFVRLFRAFVEKPALRDSDRVAVVNGELLKYYRSRYPWMSPGKFVVVPVGLDLRELADRPRASPPHGFPARASAHTLLFVGRLYPEKNVRLFIAACDVLRQRGTIFEALVVGNGIQAPIIKEAMSTRPWLHWVSAMDRTEVLDVMALSRVLVICSRYEAGPLVLLEALGLGTPVVSTDVGRARELVDDQVGRIVRPDPSSVAQGIVEALSLNREDIAKACASRRPNLDFTTTMNRLLNLARDSLARQ